MIMTTIGLGLLKGGGLYMTKYVLNGSDNCDCIWWNEDTYDSYEDAKREATDQYQRACKGEQTELFGSGAADSVPEYSYANKLCYIGEKYPFDFRIDGNDIIEMAQDRLAWDWGLDHVDYPTWDEISDLTEVMTNAFANWCKKHGYYTDIYNVINIEELYVGNAE